MNNITYEMLKELEEYIENDEYGEYLTGLINFYHVVKYSDNDELIFIIEETIKKELEYCLENLEIIYSEETLTYKTKEIIEKER